jgi:arylsulfatase A-like enzyme
MGNLCRQGLKIFVLLFAVLFYGSDCFAGFDSAKAEYAVVIIIDGCRPEYLKLAPLPNIHELAKSGVTYEQAWVGQIPNNTPPSHATLGTGVFPKRHHVVGFNWKDFKTGESFYPRSPKNLRNGIFAKVIKDAKVPSIFELYKKVYPKANTLAMSSVKPYAAIPLGNFGADYIFFTMPHKKEDYENGEEGIEKGESRLFEALSGHEVDKDLLGQINSKIKPYKQPGDFDTWAVEAFLTVFNAKRPKLSMINLPETDPTGHKWGGLSHPEYIKPVIENVDVQIGRIIKAFKEAGIFERTLFVITADHGMVTNSYDISVGSYILAFTGFKSWPQLGITTPFIWLKDSNESANVARKIQKINPFGVNYSFYKVSGSNGAVYQSGSKIQKKSLAETYRYFLQTLACPNSPDIFLFIKENTIIGKKFPLNTHGKHYSTTWITQHIPLIVSGPGIRSNYQSDMPARLVDIPPTVLTLMGVRPEDMDGIVLADALSHPLSDQVQNQKNLSEKLLSYQKALIAQSQTDLRELDSITYSTPFFYRYSLWFFDALILFCFSAGILITGKTVSSPVSKKVILTVLFVALIVSQIVFFMGMTKLLEI